MGTSLKEKALLAVVGMAALYALAVALWFLSAEGAWRRSAKAYAKAKGRYAEEVALIAQKRQLADAYESEKALMPTFEAEKATDTTWRRKLDEFAARHRVIISSAQTGKETEAGEVLELPIEVKGWEGSLEALVRLMHELENTSDGMFDITRLDFRPSSKKGYLKGSLTVNCAYMRE